MPRRGSRFLAGRASNPLAARFREIERAIRRRQRFNTSEVTTIVNNAISGGGGGGGGGSPANTLIVDDEGVQQGTAERMDFVGGGVTATVVGSTATVEVPCPCDCDEQLVLDGGFWMSPDDAAFDITGDIDLRAAIAADDYTPAFNKILINKWTNTVGNRSYLFDVQTSGALALTWSTDGSDTPFAVSTANLSALAPGDLVLVRATLDVNNGAAGKTVTFYTKTATPAHAASALASDSGWTILGSAVTTAGTTSIFSGNAELGVGGRVDGSVNGHFAGVMHAAVVKSGIDGTTVAAPDFAAQPAGTSSFDDALSNPWTLEGQSAIPVGCLGETAVYDEGVFQGTVREFDFVGSDVAAAVVGDRATVTVGGPGYRLVSVTYIAQGTTTYTTPAGIDALLVECIGAGGGAGGTTTAAVSGAYSAGGSGGAFSRKLITAPDASYTVAVGAGGAGGDTSASTGATGGDTTFGSPSVCTAKGGGGGAGMTAGTAVAQVGATAGGAVSSGVGDLLLSGGDGGMGIRLSGLVGMPGFGGTSGGLASGTVRGRSSAAAGVVGNQYGGGGGGANVSNGSAAVAGGTGANGRIIVWEYAAA